MWHRAVRGGRRGAPPRLEALRNVRTRDFRRHAAGRSSVPPANAISWGGCIRMCRFMLVDQVSQSLAVYQSNPRNTLYKYKVTESPLCEFPPRCAPSWRVWCAPMGRRLPANA